MEAGTGLGRSLRTQTRGLCPHHGPEGRPVCTCACDSRTRLPSRAGRRVDRLRGRCCVLRSASAHSTDSGNSIQTVFSFLTFICFFSFPPGRFPSDGFKFLRFTRPQCPQRLGGLFPQNESSLIKISILVTELKETTTRKSNFRQTKNLMKCWPTPRSSYHCARQCAVQKLAQRDGVELKEPYLTKATFYANLKRQCQEEEKVTL